MDSLVESFYCPYWFAHDANYDLLIASLGLRIQGVSVVLFDVEPMAAHLACD